MSQTDTTDHMLIVPGKWYTEHDENGIPVKAVYEKSYRKALGYESEEEYEDAQKKWENRIHPDDVERVEAHFRDVISKHPEGMDYNIEYRIMTQWGYRWFHDYGRCTRREDGSLHHCEGAIFDIQDIRDFELKQAHGALQKEILDYIITHDDDPVELLGNFAEKIRVLLDCDQVIYRDLKDTRIMVNSSGIEKQWHVPESYCRQCQHFNAFHPMYKDGFTEMSNCQEGWRGIPVYEKCPIKSSLTRIVYCNGEVAGYLAIHYVQNYHQFTDIERKATEEFVNNFSMALSRYQAQKELLKVQKQKDSRARQIAENYASVLALEDDLESLYDVELESGKYTEHVKGDFYQQNVADKLLPKGDYFKDLRGNIDAVIYPEDRGELFNVLDRESIRTALSKTDRVEHFYRMFVKETPMWFKIRIAYKDESRKSVIIGCFSAEKELADRKMEKQMGDVKRMMNMIQSLSDEYDPIMVLDPETGEYDWYRSLNDNIDENTSMSTHGDNLYKNIGIDGSSIIHEEDRAQFQAFYTKENMMKVATTGETQEIENRWFIQTEGIYRWKYNKAVRMEDETGKAYVVIGVIDTTERKKEEEERKQTINIIEALTENNQRIMALEDNFESLYEVELESGHYTGYIKGEFYQSNVADKLLEPGDYFEDLRGNIDAVIYPEDRDGLFNVLNRDAIRKALSEDERFEYYYRIIVDNNPVWFKIRVVYKNIAKRSVIIGVFNASKELETRQIEEQNAKIAEEQKRNDVLHEIIHSGKWSFFVNARDEVIRAEYSEGLRQIINNDFTPEPYSWIDIVHPFDKEKVLAAFNATIADHSCNTPYDLVFRMIDRNGQYNWFHSAGRIVRDEDGNGELFGVHINVTDTVEEQQRRAAAMMSKSMNMFFTLSNEYDPIIVVEPESGEYDWYMGQAEELTVNTSMTLHGDNLYQNIGIDGSSIIHEEDRAQFKAFYTRENMMKIAQTGETQETENRWFLKLEGRYKWKYNKAVRMLDENGKALVVIGVIDTTEKKEKETALELERQQAQQQLEHAYEEARDANQRNDILLKIAKAGKWSYSINEKDEVVSSQYADKTLHILSDKFPDKPMAWVDFIHPETEKKL